MSCTFDFLFNRTFRHLDSPIAIPGLRSSLSSDASHQPPSDVVVVVEARKLHHFPDFACGRAEATVRPQVARNKGLPSLVVVVVVVVVAASLSIRILHHP